MDRRRGAADEFTGSVWSRVERDAGDAQLLTAANDAKCNLASVRDKDACDGLGAIWCDVERHATVRWRVGWKNLDRHDGGR